MGILHILRAGGKSGEEVEGECGCGGSTVRRNLKILRDAGLVERRDGIYSIPENKRFLLEDLLDTSELFDAYGEHREYWDSHELASIPKAFREELDALQGGEIVRGTTTNPRAGFDRYRGLIKESNWLKGVTPAIVPETEEAFLERIDQGIPVDVIVTRNVVSLLEERYGETLSNALDRGNLRIYLFDDIRFGFTVTDLFMRIVLHRDDGTYDLNTYYFSRKGEAREWAERMFDWFRERSEGPVTL